MIVLICLRLRDETCGINSIVYKCSNAWMFHPVGGCQYSDLAKPELHRKAYLENTRPDNVS